MHWLKAALDTRARKLIAILGSAYMIVVVGVAGCKSCRTRREGEPNYVARETFPANHRIVAADLITPMHIKGTFHEIALPDPASFAGKYLAHAVDKGRTITLRDLTDDPHIAAEDGMAILPVALPADLPTSLVDVGTVVDVIAGGRRVLQNARVAALSCHPSCVALVAVPRNIAPVITADKGISAVLINHAKSAVVPASPKTKGADMSKTWQEPVKVEVPSMTKGLWKRVLDYVPPGTILKFETDPSAIWTYADRGAFKCGADGDPSAPGDPALLLPDAPVGSIIGKIGGSSAGKADGARFVVGSFAVITLTAEQSGPLYLAMNTNPANRPTTAGKMIVELSEAKR